MGHLKDMRQLAKPFCSANRLEYWPIPGKEQQIASCMGARHMSLEEEWEKVETMQELHDEGKMERGVVLSRMSEQSRRSFARWVSSHLSLFRTGKGRSAFMVVLTYGDQFPNCKESKLDIEKLAKRMETAFDDGVLLWGLENQSLRGAPHYNLLISVAGSVSRDDFMSWARDAWIGITGSGGSSMEAREARAVAVSSVWAPEGAANYLTTELGKTIQKEFDEGSHPGRWWGVYGKRRADRFYRAPERIVLCEDVLSRLEAISEFYGLDDYRIQMEVGGELRWVWFIRTRWFGWGAEYAINGNEWAWEKIEQKAAANRS